MSLYRETERDDKTYRRRLIKRPYDSLIRRESFFISDKGGQNGIRIDHVERRQAA